MQCNIANYPSLNIHKSLYIIFTLETIYKGFKPKIARKFILRAYFTNVLGIELYDKLTFRPHEDFLEKINNYQ